MENEESDQTASPPTEPLGKWETIMADDFGLYCVKAFLKRELEKTGTVENSDAELEVSDNNLDSKMEVLEKIKNDKFGRFLNSEEYKAWSKYFGLQEWYRTHEFDYDKESMFELFLKDELPVAIQIGTVDTSLIGVACAVTSSGNSTVETKLIQDDKGGDSYEWNCHNFEKFLLETSGDTEFSCKWTEKGHKEYPIIKDMPITRHLNSGVMKGMPRILTSHIQVDMQGYDYTIENIDGNDVPMMTASKLVSTGTVERLCDGFNKKGKPAILGNQNSSLLTNIYVVNTTICHQYTNEYISSIRYGTPVREASIEHLSKRHHDLTLFAQQIRPRKTPGEPNRICVLSFLDHCNHDVMFGQETAVKRKGHEDEILRVELGLERRDNVMIQQLSASASLMFRVSQGVETTGFREMLEMWCEGVDDAMELLKHSYKKHGCFDSSFHAKLRLKEFIAISMIQFILQVDSPFNFILCYHCMSGKDRTGMFFAINQTVHHFCAGLKKALDKKEGDNTRKSEKRPSKLKKSINGLPWKQLFDDLCKLKPTWFDTKLDDESMGYILDKFIRRSILITGASTGWFGLKFGIGQTNNFKKGLLKGLKKSVNHLIGANPVASLLAPHNKIMDWQLDSQNADS